MTVHATVGIYLPLVTVLTVLCNGTRDSLHGIFSGVTVHATVGMYLPIDNMFTVLCGGTRNSLQSIFSAPLSTLSLARFRAPLPAIRHKLHKIFVAHPTHARRRFDNQPDVGSPP